MSARPRVSFNNFTARRARKPQTAVPPGPMDAVHPVLIDDFPAPQLRIYPGYTVIAEKLHAIALLGMTNSRLKDYLDVSVMRDRETPDAETLAGAIAATVTRRGVAVPASLPVGLTDEFATDLSRQTLWHALLKKNELAQQALPDIVTRLRSVLEPALLRAISLTDQTR